MDLLSPASSLKTVVYNSSSMHDFTRIKQPLMSCGILSQQTLVTVSPEIGQSSKLIHLNLVSYMCDGCLKFHNCQ